MLAVSRVDAAARREYLVVVNAGESAARVTVPTGTPNATWTSLLGAAPGTRTAANGRLALTVPPLTSLLLRADARPAGARGQAARLGRAR